MILMHVEIRQCPKSTSGASKNLHCQRQLVVNPPNWVCRAIQNTSTHMRYLCLKETVYTNFLDDNKLILMRLMHVKIRQCPKSTCGASKTHYCQRLLVVNPENRVR